MATIKLILCVVIFAIIMCVIVAAITDCFDIDEDDDWRREHDEKDEDH